MQRFTKVRDTGSVVVLHYTTEPNEQSKDHHEFVSEDRPHPSFAAALQAFKPFAAQLLDFADDYLAAARVVSVTVSRKGAQRGATIHVVRPCSRATAPANFHTPHVKEQAAALDEDGEGEAPGDDAVGVWLPGMDEALDQLEREAVAFINGKREQGDLFEQPVEAHRTTAEPEPVGA